MKSFTLYPIGTVKAEGETATLQLDAAYIPGLDGLEGFSHLVVLLSAFFSILSNPAPKRRGGPSPPARRTVQTRLRCRW